MKTKAMRNAAPPSHDAVVGGSMSNLLATNDTMTLYTNLIFFDFFKVWLRCCVEKTD